MSDLVVTVPQHRWWEWLAEGQLPGDASPGAAEEFAFYLALAHPPIRPGERVYIVAHGRLRGYAPLVRVAPMATGSALVRRRGAVAVTLPERIVGFRGYRLRWWDRRQEVPFPDWRTAAAAPQQAALWEAP